MGFILFFLFILSVISDDLPDGEKRLMKQQTRISAPLLNLEASQRLLSSSSLISVPPCLRGESCC